MQEYTKAAKEFVEEHPTGVTAVLLTGRQKLNHRLHVSNWFDKIMASQNNQGSLGNETYVNMSHFYNFIKDFINRL